MNWRTDLDAAPRGQHVTNIVTTKNGARSSRHFVSEPVILASKCGKVVKSKWLEDGRWEFFNKGEQPVAWQPWPTHPGAAK